MRRRQCLSRTHLKVVDLFLLLIDIHVEDLILVRQLLEVVGALRRLLQVVEVSGLEQLLEVLDLRIQGNAQHVDFFEVLVANFFAQLLELVLCLQNKDDTGDQSLRCASLGENIEVK